MHKRSDMHSSSGIGSDEGITAMPWSVLAN
jgi:hypothetical protein